MIIYRKEKTVLTLVKFVGLISCEEGWDRRGLVSSPYRILGQSRGVVVRATAVGGIDIGGVFEFESTKNVAFHGK
jgi:hypothetical protein